MIQSLFLYNWQKKIIALLIATIVWIFVNQSFVETTTLPQVSIKVINLPPGKTISGMLPNGTLAKRITLTLTGTKHIIEKLESGDVGVVVDGSSIHQNEWILQVTKNNLVSLNPSINLSRHITQIAHKEYVLKFSNLITEKIPVTILNPLGEPPEGYLFLGVTPQTFYQVVTGPEREILDMKVKGLELQFNLNEITKADLDEIQLKLKKQANDEVSFLVPNKWKYVTLPFYRNPQVKELNDPSSDLIRLDFLALNLLPIEKEIPIRVYYPSLLQSQINPKTSPLLTNELIVEKNGVMTLNTPLFARHVGKFFLNLVRDHLEIALIASPKGEPLKWSLQILNPNLLEDQYVAYWMSNKTEKSSSSRNSEGLYRKRFKHYMQTMRLFVSKDTPLQITATWEDQGIVTQIEGKT